MKKSSTWQNSLSKLSIVALLEACLSVAQVYSSEPLLTSRKSELTLNKLVVADQTWVCHDILKVVSFEVTIVGLMKVNEGWS